MNNNYKNLGLKNITLFVYFIIKVKQILKHFDIKSSERLALNEKFPYFFDILTSYEYNHKQIFVLSKEINKKKNK